MNPIVKNILALVAGILVGSIVNMGLVALGGILIAPPEGADVSTMEGLKESMHLFEIKHFIFPFLGHALGTLSGAVIAALLAASHKIKFALGVGLWFLVGGIFMVNMVGGPLWFNTLDLLVAYIPMAWIGGSMIVGCKTK